MAAQASPLDLMCQRCSPAGPAGPAAAAAAAAAAAGFQVLVTAQVQQVAPVLG